MGQFVEQSMVPTVPLFDVFRAVVSFMLFVGDQTDMTEKLDRQILIDTAVIG